MERFNPAITISIKELELKKELVSEGIASIVSREILKDYYVKDVDVFDDAQIIIYLERKGNANIAKFNDLTWESGIYPLKLSKDEK